MFAAGANLLRGGIGVARAARTASNVARAAESGALGAEAAEFGGQAVGAAARTGVPGITPVGAVIARSAATTFLRSARVQNLIKATGRLISKLIRKMGYEKAVQNLSAKFKAFMKSAKLDTALGAVQNQLEFIDNVNKLKMQAEAMDAPSFGVRREERKAVVKKERQENRESTAMANRNKRVDRITNIQAKQKERETRQLQKRKAKSNKQEVLTRNFQNKQKARAVKKVARQSKVAERKERKVKRQARRKR